MKPMRQSLARLCVCACLAAAVPAVVHAADAHLLHGQWSTDGARAHAQLGISVALAGDIDRDGYSDVLVGAPGDSQNAPNAGRVLLFCGSQKGLLRFPS